MVECLNKAMDYMDQTVMADYQGFMEAGMSYYDSSADIGVLYQYPPAILLLWLHLFIVPEPLELQAVAAVWLPGLMLPGHC